MAGLSNSFPVYCPAEDLRVYLGVRVDDAEALVAEASLAVRGWTKGSVYSIDTADGYTPLVQAVKDAFHDATLLQAAAMQRSGIGAGETVASQSPAIQSKSLGGRSVTYATDATAVEAKNALLGGALAPQAVAVLRAAGLLRATVHTGGEADYDVLARQWVTG